MPQYKIVKTGDKFFIERHLLLHKYKYLIFFDSLWAAREQVLSWQSTWSHDGNVNWVIEEVVWEG